MQERQDNRSSSIDDSDGSKRRRNSSEDDVVPTEEKNPKPADGKPSEERAILQSNSEETPVKQTNSKQYQMKGLQDHHSQTVFEYPAKISLQNSQVGKFTHTNIMDIETALSFSLPDTNIKSDQSCNNSERERLIHYPHQNVNNKVEQKEDVWLKFRLGNAGDASALAVISPKIIKRRRRADICNISSNTTTKRRRHSEDNMTSTNRQSLNDEVEPSDRDATVMGESGGSSESEFESDVDMELRLASGFGDEHTPPAFYAIIAEVHQERNQPATPKQPSIDDHTFAHISSAAIVTLEWESNSCMRILRADILKEQNSKYGELITRRLVLRLIRVGLSTGCGALHLREVSPVSQERF